MARTGASARRRAPAPEHRRFDRVGTDAAIPPPARPEARIVRWIAHGVGATRSTSHAVVHGACLTLVPSLALGGLLYGLLHALGIDPGPGAREDLTGAPDEWIGVVLVAPLLETLMMVGLLYALRPLRTKLRIALASAGAWGLLHAAIAWGAFLAAWPFFVFSLVYLERRPLGFRAAFAATAGVHGLHNAVLLAAAGVAG